MGDLRHARYVQQRRTAGSPTGRESYGDGVPVVVVGVTTHQGGRESRSQGEGAQATMRLGDGRYAKCRTPQQSRPHWVYNLDVVTGEPYDEKLSRAVREEADGTGPTPRAPHRRPTSLGRGRWKRSSTDWASAVPRSVC